MNMYDKNYDKMNLKFVRIARITQIYLYYRRGKEYHND